MSGNLDDVGPDGLLREYLRAQTENERRSLLERLLSEHVKPQVRAIVRRVIADPVHQLRSVGDAIDLENAEDISQEALVNIVQVLSRMGEGTGQKIQSLDGYTFAVASRACDNYLRQKYPRRRSLNNRLRYLISHSSRFTLWYVEGTGWVCGPVRSRTARVAPRAILTAHFPRQRFKEFRAEDLANAVNTLFQVVAGPVLFRELVRFFVDLWEVVDEASRNIPPSDLDSMVERVPLLADPYLEVALREQLRDLWEGICHLPLLKRRVLLLNLRDERRRGVIELFPTTGLVSIEEVAAVLGMSTEDFRRLQLELPLEDAEIGRRYGISTQRVTKLRWEARNHLSTITSGALPLALAKLDPEERSVTILWLAGVPLRTIASIRRLSLDDVQNYRESASRKLQSQRNARLLRYLPPQLSP